MGESVGVAVQAGPMPTVPIKSFVEIRDPKSDLLHGQRETRGHHAISSLGGSRLHDNVIQTARQLPKIGQYIVDGVANGLANTNLSYRDWAIASISALIVTGDCTEQLNDYVEAALRHGVQVEEIWDLFQHAQSFAGNPRTIKAIRATHQTISAFQNPNLPAEYAETTVRLQDHDTLVCDTHPNGGNGTIPIILIHALCLDSRMFKDVLPALATSTGTRVIAYDLRGHGRARGGPLTTSLQHLATDLESLLDALAIPRADIYGASYGGCVAQYFALDHSTRVRSLGLLATFGTAPPAFLSRATRAEQHSVLSLLPETIVRWFRPETIAADPWCVRYARACIERARMQEWAAAWRAMSRLDTIHRLHELTIPVLALSGTHDASATPAYMRAIVDACVNAKAEFVAVDNGTHMMVMEQPSDVVAKLAAFWKKVEGAPAGEDVVVLGLSSGSEGEKVEFIDAGHAERQHGLGEMGPLTIDVD